MALVEYDMFGRSIIYNEGKTYTLEVDDDHPTLVEAVHRGMWLQPAMSPISSEEIDEEFPFAKFHKKLKLVRDAEILWNSLRILWQRLSGNTLLKKYAALGERIAKKLPTETLTDIEERFIGLDVTEVGERSESQFEINPQAHPAVAKIILARRNIIANNPLQSDT